MTFIKTFRSIFTEGLCVLERLRGVGKGDALSDSKDFALHPFQAIYVCVDGILLGKRNKNFLPMFFLKEEISQYRDFEPEVRCLLNYFMI